MKKLNFLMLFLLAFLFTSCDPAQSLFFVNKEKGNAKVKLILNSKVINEELDKIKTGDSIVFHLKPAGTEESDVQIYFGMGTWRDSEIIEVAKSIKSIEIENDDNLIVYKSEKTITKLLLQNQEGLIWKTTININIDDNLLH
ncbi:hypothetical protein ACFFLS_02840 [Flavobacterium procerum]|uniref:Lipoprotein n=1 Tax=Flavobacterium procerum TaxID=1455569 RepID=A0ABV6BMV6_9FLAO